MVFNGTLFIIKQYSYCKFFQLLGLISFWILVLIIMQGSAGMT